MQRYSAKVTKSEVEYGQYQLLTIEQSDIVKAATPGQFVYVKKGAGFDPLLPRPISIHRINPVENTLELLFEIKGKGTQQLSRLFPGDLLSIVGPLGNGFQLPPKEKTVALVGGGIGVAPLLFLADTLVAKGHKPKIFLGYRNEHNLVAYHRFVTLGCPVEVATEDGSLGSQGRITSLVEDFLGQVGVDWLYACGPHLMLQAIQRLDEVYKVETCQLSLEARMGCGIGACMACVCGVRQKNGETGYGKVCSDGPVFLSREVVFDE